MPEAQTHPKLFPYDASDVIQPTANPKRWQQKKPTSHDARPRVMVTGRETPPVTFFYFGPSLREYNQGRALLLPLSSLDLARLRLSPVAAVLRRTSFS
jgi:hypothetical protein